MQRPLVIAHRGQSLDHPEQTMAAYRAAIRLGADMIEADVRRSADGRLVMMHDGTLDRTTDGTGPVAERSWQELQQLDAGAWFSPSFAGERIPSLDDLFDLAAEHGIALCLEAKGESAQDTLAIARLTAEAIAERGRLDVDNVASFDHEALRVAAAAVPGLRVSPDRLPERGASTADELLRQARACGATIIQHHCDDLEPGVVAAVQAEGVEIWAWPATTPEQVDRAVRSGVAGVMGDDVGAILERLDS